MSGSDVYRQHVLTSVSCHPVTTVSKPCQPTAGRTSFPRAYRCRFGRTFRKNLDLFEEGGNRYLEDLFESISLSTIMLAAATSFFSRTAISQSYNYGPSAAGSRSPTPGPSGSPSVPLPAASHTPTFNVGLWRVQSATHKFTNKRVSVWSFDKRSGEADRTLAMGKDKAIEVLKAEVCAEITRRARQFMLKLLSGLCVRETSASECPGYASLTTLSAIL